VEGLIGGAFSEAGGGRFGDGFLAAAVGSLDEPLLKGIGVEDVYHSTAQAMVAAAIGGTLSDIAGGNFADGAITAAFQNLFNNQADDRRIAQEKAEMLAAINDPTVRAAMDKAWDDSNPDGKTATDRKEHAFWILKDTATGAYSVKYVDDPNATNDKITPGATPVVEGKTVIAYFHTHPNPHYDYQTDKFYPQGVLSEPDRVFMQERNMPMILESRDGTNIFTP
jgi:hypothetical protein